MSHSLLHIKKEENYKEMVNNHDIVRITRLLSLSPEESVSDLK